MQDMHVIHETFHIMSQCSGADMHGIMFWLFDPHDEADAWIKASDAERVRLRAIAEAKHARIIVETARMLRKEPRYIESITEYRRTQMHAAQRRWRESHREHCRLRSQRRRAKIKADPVLYAADMAANRARMKRKNERLKAKRHAANPPKPKRSLEERIQAKRDWNREYQRKHPPKRSPEQMQRRREYYLAEYHRKKKLKETT